MFFGNYSKPGKGVNKRDPNQPRNQVFFDILPRRMWKLIKLNIVYLLLSLPFFVVTMLIVGVISSPMVNSISSSLDNLNILKIDLALRFLLALVFMIFFGQGPLTAGFTYIIREIGREHHCWLVGDFIKETKSNFKQGTILWIIDLIVLYSVVIAFKFYLHRNMLVFIGILTFAVAVYGMIHIYAYQMMITFDLSLKNILKNSLLLAFGNLPVSLLIFFMNLIVYIIIPVMCISMCNSSFWLSFIYVFELLILPPITNFATNFYIEPILDKYIKK